MSSAPSPPLDAAAAPAVAAAALPPAVELQGLSVRYGQREILHNLSAQFRGRVTGLLGPNGAGKSTLIHTLLGFVAPSQGQARVLGHDVRRERKALRPHIGYMPENDAFVGPMSAVAMTRMMAELSGLPAEAALERAHEALFYVGLGEARYRPLREYSLGMKQMAKLAQAIVHGPHLLILDEPTNSLDAPARVRMLELVRQIRDTGACRILLCSHLLRDVEETCDEVVILKQGGIVHQADLASERRAHARWLDLEVASDEYEAAALNAERDRGFRAAALQLGCTVEDGLAGRIRLTLAEGVAVRDIYGLAGERQLRLQRLSFRRDSLEDIFLRAMAAGGDATAPGAAQAGEEA